MARARFSCAKCGAEVTIQARSVKEADRLAAYRESTKATCQDCWAQEQAAKREAEAQQAKQNANSMGLPVLSGSEKACAWAEQIRIEIVQALERVLIITGLFISVEVFGRLSDDEKLSLRDALDKALPSLNYNDQNRANWLLKSLGDHALCVLAVEFIKRQTSASWWIDHRFALMDGQFKMLVEEVKPHAIQQAKDLQDAALPPEQAAFAAAVKEAAILLPGVELEVPMPAEISISPGAKPVLQVHLPIKNDVFRKLMHEHGLRWEATRWIRKLDPMLHGSAEHRASELACALLASGFSVALQNEDARAMAVSGAYLPECTRWVMALTAGPHAGKFGIQWRKPDDLYEDAKRILGARWAAELKMVVAPAGSADEVEEFANEHGFSLTHGAADLAASHRRAMASGQVVCTRPKAHVVTAKSTTNNPPELAPIASEIDPALLDD